MPVATVLFKETSTGRSAGATTSSGKKKSLGFHPNKPKPGLLGTPDLRPRLES